MERKMSKPKIGKPKRGGVKKNYWKLKDGSAVYGILPPFGDLADDGIWSVYYKVQYGYKNPEGKSRAFNGCEVKNRKPPYMTEIPDAATDRISMLKGKLEAAKVAKDDKTKTALLKLVGGPKSQYNTDSNHYLNAIDLQGNIGILKLRHKAFQALKAEIEKLEKKGVIPHGVENRRFFTFTRTGNAMDTTFKVDVYKEVVATKEFGDVERDVVHTLTDEILERLSDEAGKLDTLYKSPTSEQVAQIVAESDLKTGISPNIDNILGFTSNDEEEPADDGDEEPNPGETSKMAKSAAAAAPVAQEAAPAITPEVVQEETKPTVAKIVEAKKETPAVAQASAKPTTAEALSGMSDADFLKYLDVP
jgi:hypothetical protein